jgi:RNA polymerase sigma-70 factor, ECF subfamily
MQNEAWDLTLAHHVSEALATLPDDERRAIELAYFEGRTYVQVAEILNQPEGTVKSRIRNGMRRMRRTLLESGVTEVERS